LEFCCCCVFVKAATLDDYEGNSKLEYNGWIPPGRYAFLCILGQVQMVQRIQSSASRIQCQVLHHYPIGVSFKTTSAEVKRNLERVCAREQWWREAGRERRGRAACLTGRMKMKTPL
jgi:hypothetical protein